MQACHLQRFWPGYAFGQANTSSLVSLTFLIGLNVSADVFIVVLFVALALWLAIGMFSSRLASEANCQTCGEPVSYVLSKRGVNDVAVCGSCGIAVGSISLIAEQSNDQEGPG